MVKNSGVAEAMPTMAMHSPIIEPTKLPCVTMVTARPTAAMHRAGREVPAPLLRAVGAAADQHHADDAEDVGDGGVDADHEQVAMPQLLISVGSQKTMV